MADARVFAEVDDDGRAAVVAAFAAAGAHDVEVCSAWAIVDVDGVDEDAADDVDPVIAGAALVGGVVGAASSYALQWWVSVMAQPIDAGGRPLHAAPAFVPLTFIGAVLFASLALFAALLWRARLPRLAHPGALPARARATRDGHTVTGTIDVGALGRLRADARAAGASDVIARVARASAVVAVVAVAGGGACTPADQTFVAPDPGLVRLQRQPRADDLDETAAFADGAVVRPPPAGTRPFGPAPQRPLLDAALLDEGERVFAVSCAVCHGFVGDGDSVVARHMTLVPPADLHTPRLRAASFEHVYDVVTDGYGAMRGYAASLTVRQRTAVAHYVKALQLARHAPRDDAPRAAP